jgi:site-specific recombinase XerD
MFRKQYSKAKVLNNAKTINREIDNKIAELTLLQNNLRATHGRLDTKSIKKIFELNPNLDRSKNFLIYADRLRDNLLQIGKIGTYKRYKTVLKRLKEYVKDKPLPFEDITYQFLNEYESHLIIKKLKTNSVHNHFKTIRAIYNESVKEEIIPQDKNPFVKFKLKKEISSKKEKLNIEEIKKIESLDLKKGSLLWDCRNYFIFSFNLGGIRIGDLLKLKWNNITPDGRLDYYMAKTGGFRSVIISDKAKEILSEYFVEAANTSSFIFPMLNKLLNYDDPLVLFNQVSAKTALVNKYLKKIAALAEVKKNLTTHIARHSFSDIARKNNVSIHDIKNILGHSSIKITEGYMSNFDLESQDNAMKNTLNF